MSRAQVEPVETPPAVQRNRWGWIIAVVVVVIAVVAAIATAAILIAEEGSVTATRVNWFGTNPCGDLSGNVTAGLHGPEGGLVRYIVPDVHSSNATSSCTIHSVEPLDPGFAVTSGNLPLTIPANASVTLNITIGLPHAASEGNVSLTVL
jgi:hypothetical protein